jgi:hypothetical protein
MEVRDPKALASEIADTLGETHKSPRKRIALIVQLCGVAFAQDILRQTVEIEASGGMLTSKGDRRRTPGGVFFRLAKDQMGAEIRAKIFPPITWKERKRQRQELQEKRAAQAAAKKSQSGATNAGRIVVDMPLEAEAQLHQLQSAAAVLREKLAAIEATGHRPGAEMTRRVLENTERQIAALMQQYTQ